MRIFQSALVNGQWTHPLPTDSEAQLVLVFGNISSLNASAYLHALQHAFPLAQITGCTTSGEIIDDIIYDQSLSVTAITFDTACVYVESAHIGDFNSESQLAEYMVNKLPKQELKHILVLSDGQKVNGSELVDGFQKCLPDDVTMSGGLAGDGDNFEETTVIHNAHICSNGLISVVCFYGDALQFGFGSYGGWQAFGPDREVTSSNKNTVYKIDNQPALELYKSFLGEYAQDLPSSALLYPLQLKEHNKPKAVVRTILSINEQDNSLVFAGNMPEGAICQLMHANTEQLVDGAENAVAEALQAFDDSTTPQLAILVSCVGRRLVMSQRVEEELEVIRDVLPSNCAINGFYSYGEISPLQGLLKCGLHNQTMTITLINEA